MLDDEYTLGNMTKKVQFTSLTVGPEGLCAIGPSGWPEVFKRSDCVKKLEEFLGETAVKDAVQALHSLMESKRSEFPNRTLLWGDAVGFLARIKRVREGLIPIPAVLAIWALTLEYVPEPGEEAN